MSAKKIIVGILSWVAIALVIVCLWQAASGHYTAALATGIPGIILAIVYFIFSVPDFVKDMKEAKKKKAEKDQK